MRISALPFACLFLFFSCNQPVKQNEKQTAVVQPAADSGTKTTVTETGNFKIILESPAQQFTVASNKVSSIIAKKGLIVTIDPAALETEDGAAAGDRIDVEVKEMTNQEELFKNDAPTVSDGRLLVSGGAYYIGMQSNGNKLRLKANRTLKLDIPRIADKEMELFYGQRDSTGNLNWKAAGEKLAAKPATFLNEPAYAANNTTEKYENLINKGEDSLSDIERLALFVNEKGGRISKREFDSFAKYKPGNSDKADFKTRIVEISDKKEKNKKTRLQLAYYNPVEISNLGWINCDRFYNLPVKTLLQCEPDSLLTTNSVAVYIIYKNYNAMQKEYLRYNGQLFSGENDDYPAGQPVKIIAVANINGDFYSARHDYILGNSKKVKFKFSKVSNIDLITKSYSY
ncbi:MAG: hypothetical protein QM791_21810 [Ferruginibacter sp.]